MDMILICRDALEDSLIGNVAMAMEAKKAGYDVGILFTEEALAALAGESFRWSPLFESRPARAKISRNATAMGIQVASVKDSRWTDPSRLLEQAKETGIKLLACPIWTQVLGVNGKLPPQVTSIDSATMLKELHEAKTIIGGL